MLDHTLRGDLRERVDGGFEGWCWAPDRPEERLLVDLLVNDTLAASIVAAVFRRDLQLRGIGDGRHGFSLRLPPNMPEANGEHIVTARERASGTVFGRVLRGAGHTQPGIARLDRVGGTMDELWTRLETARAGAATPAAAQLRDALGVLAGRLAARHQPHRAAGDIDPGAHPRGPPILLPDLQAPELTIVLRAGGAQATLRRLAALAPAADLAHAEIIVVDPGRDPYVALLPAQVRNLRYLRDGAAETTAAAANLAAPHARGEHLLVLAEATAEPSAAALLALARAAARVRPALLLGPGATAALARAGEPAPREAARLHGRLGMAFCLDRALWQELGPLDTALHDGAALECADMAFRARLLGRAVLAVAEPAPAAPVRAGPASLVPPAEARRALAAFAARWGAATLDPARRPA